MLIRNYNLQYPIFTGSHEIIFNAIVFSKCARGRVLRHLEYRPGCDEVSTKIRYLDLTNQIPRLMYSLKINTLSATLVHSFLGNIRVMKRSIYYTPLYVHISEGLQTQLIVNSKAFTCTALIHTQFFFCFFFQSKQLQLVHSFQVGPHSQELSSVW